MVAENTAAVSMFDGALAPLEQPSARKEVAGHDIVCFANDWSGDPLSKKHVMTRLARHNRVLWVNSLGNRAPRATTRDLGRIADKLTKFAKHLTDGPVEVAPNIWVMTPIAVPNYHSPAARAFNERIIGATVRRAMRTLGFESPLLYTF